MSEFHAGKLRQRNREVPFPDNESLYEIGALEQFILDDSWFNYFSLPEIISSGAIDKYATWLSQLTDEDPLHRERGSFLFIDDENRKWILPTNPLIGSDSEVANLTTKDPKKHLPIARFHSHPDSTAPSGADISRMLDDKGWFFEGESDAYIDVIGAQRFNYLILRCFESEFLGKVKIDMLLSQYQEIVNNANISLSQFVASLAHESGLAEHEFNNVLNSLALREQEQFGSDYSRFFSTLNVINAIAEQQKFGFYRSSQDGVFRKITREDLASIRENEGKLIVETINSYIDNA